ncbi:MAG: hypothetical protein J4F42_14460 [Desulfurellaceae bacterium]|nr:hypothetical protein [Desulfurellaceae bacterium]
MAGHTLAFVVWLWPNQPHPPSEKLLHHALFDSADFVPAALQSGNLGIHVGEDGSYQYFK